jgi:N-acylneuraminate cytidylyltransferase
MVTALIPLRGGSKSIVNKNIKEIAGRPLCEWVLNAARQSERINRVFVSTESKKIRHVVEGLGLDVIVIDRPMALATDDSSTEEVMLHFAKTVPFDILCTIQATSPLLTAWDLDSAIDVFETGGYDSLLTAVRTTRFFWTDDFRPMNYDPRRRPRRQDFRGTLMENGAFYLTRRETLEATGCRLGGRIGIYEMGAETAVEIDAPEDWAVVEGLLEKRTEP